jgi:hypothetical protein
MPKQGHARSFFQRAGGIEYTFFPSPEHYRLQPIKRWMQTMLRNKTMIVLSAGILLGAATDAFAASDESPADTSNGPYFYADTYGVPASQLQTHQPDRLSRERLRTHNR